MNNISKKPISKLGYGFIPKEFIPKGKNEYHLRNLQNRSGINYRKINASEKETLIRNANSSDNWNNIFVSDSFNPDLVKNCKFYGLVRIGKLESFFLEFNNLRLPVGLYNSTIISCDFGDNVVVDNVNYLSHYILGNEVMLVNINEMATTDHAKFGNGVLKDGEDESVRVWMELCNENAGRKVMPFNGMQPGDAYLWSKYQNDSTLQQKFKEFTEKRFDKQRGYYGKIGDRTVIKNCKIIKDVWIGSDAYLKGANKLKNLTINSSSEAKSQIGEGCEIVNGIIGFGCRVFYGVKAVRFIMSSNSQLKYGARLINSYLGDNSTISCCEVLNSLIFPAHEQHHNNSFLCAATVMGQTNMAAGATIGSNHNSRGADGELVAGRGFWPGLCVSLKHNSKFASFTIIAKGDFSAELNIPIPFSLVNNDVSKDKLVIMPGYWFLYNMYALARNADKYVERDKRTDKTQNIEYDFLAPDTVNEIFDALELMKKFTGLAYQRKTNEVLGEKNLVKTGEQLLERKEVNSNELEILVTGFENTKRIAELVKTEESYHLFKKMIQWYGTIQLLSFIETNSILNWEQLISQLPFKAERKEWQNIGGQLIPKATVSGLLRKINTGKIMSWDEVHAFYRNQTTQYPEQKFQHSFASLLEIKIISSTGFTKKIFNDLLFQAIATKEWMVKSIYESRAKDYTNEFRKMVYDTNSEMNHVLGKLTDNVFIKTQKEELKLFKKKVKDLIKTFQL